MSFRFFSLPAHEVVDHPRRLRADALLEPSLPPSQEAVTHALRGAEFRDLRARDRVQQLLSTDQPPPHGSPGEGWGPSAIFAQPPSDLPALLRMADQLELLARQESGEQALVWKCAQCGTRYAVPVALVRPVSIRCERCQTGVQLSMALSLGEEALLDPFQGVVNACRRELATFFRESMARGWPVLVASDADLKS